MLLVLLLCNLVVGDGARGYRVFDVRNAAHDTPISPDCAKAVETARRYDVHIYDTDQDGLITHIDVGLAAIAFGMHWLDDAPRDGVLSMSELIVAWNAKAKWWLKTASWATSLFTTQFTPAQVFLDCASTAHPDRITIEDYRVRSSGVNATCMETCNKAFYVFDFLGSSFGKATRLR